MSCSLFLWAHWGFWLILRVGQGSPLPNIVYSQLKLHTCFSFFLLQILFCCVYTIFLIKFSPCASSSLCTISPSKHKTTNIQFAVGWVSTTQSWVLSKSAKLRYFGLTFLAKYDLFLYLKAPTGALRVMWCHFWSVAAGGGNFLNVHRHNIKAFIQNRDYSISATQSNWRT